jgi:glycerol kinase
VVNGVVLAIDQGTSGTKALVVCPERGVLASAHRPVRPAYLDGGLVEQDPQELLASVVEAGCEALAAAGGPVDAVGLANQGETVLAWDPGTGEPLTTALVWQDRRSETVCGDIADAAPRLRQITGLPLDPYFAAPKMAWLRRHATRKGVVTTSDAWLVHRLTGAFVTDASTASRTMLLDLRTTEWSTEALDTFGLAGEELPAVVDCAGPVGETSAFGRSLPLTGLMVDQQAALLAQRCLAPGDTKCTYGTGAFVLANAGGSPPLPAAALVASIGWRDRAGAAYCLDGQVYTVGSAVRWLTEVGILTGDGAAAIDGLGGSAPDAGGVTFVPAFAGLAAPSWRGDARAQLGGLSLSTSRGHVVRALCGAMAAEVALLVEAIEGDLGTPVRALRVDGGLTRSSLLVQTQADLLQRPVEVHAVADATALGVAAAARAGLSPSAVLADAVLPGPPPVRCEPRVSADAAAATMGSYRQAVARVLADPERL